MHFCALALVVFMLVIAHGTASVLVLNPMIPVNIDVGSQPGTAETGATTGAKILSFEVLSILPSNNAGRQRLGDNTPITVVFSLPVIRLGTDLVFIISAFVQRIS